MDVSPRQVAHSRRGRHPSFFHLPATDRSDVSAAASKMNDDTEYVTGVEEAQAALDTCAVILVIHYWAGGLPIDEDAPLWPQLITYIASGYVFKLAVALADTGPIYALVAWLRPFLGIDKNQEIGPGDEPVMVSSGPKG